MTSSAGMHRLGQPPDSNRGFSLVEVVISLAVLAVATFILTSLFFASNRLNEQARFETIAIHIGDAALAQLAVSPEAFTWPDLDDRPPGEPAAILGAGAGDEVFQAAPPSVQLTHPRDENLSSAYYGGFTWRAFAVAPQDSDAYVRVVVQVEWEREGVAYARTMASAQPVSLMEASR